MPSLKLYHLPTIRNHLEYFAGYPIYLFTIRFFTFAEKWSGYFTFVYIDYTF